MYKSGTHYFFIILGVVHFYSFEVDGNLQSDIDSQLKKANSTSLSRTRRYLVFPEGSSFQVVFDLAYPTLDGIGLYVFGNTAGLAWELPSTPIFLDKKYHKKEEPEPTTTMLPHLEHPVEPEHDWQPPSLWNDPHELDYQDFGKWQNKASIMPTYDLTYSSKFGQIDRSPVSTYTNPFDSYSKKGFNPKYMSRRYPVQYNKVNNHRGNSYRSNPNYFWNRRTFQSKRNQVPMKPVPVQTFRIKMDPFDRDLHHNIHRRTRRELYTKLEELLSVIIKNGKSCILKTICQVNKTPKGKGTLWEELLKTIFKNITCPEILRVKPDDFYEDEDHYDQAANPAHNCDEMFPECKTNIINQVINTAINK